MKRIHYILAGGIILITAAGSARFMRTNKEPPSLRHIRAARELERIGKLREAGRRWQVAVALDPKRVEAREGLAQAYLRDDAAGLAVREMRAVVDLAPERKHAYCRLAEACQRAGLAEPALRAAEYATASDPNCSRAFRVHGLLLVDRQDYRAALKQLGVAVRLAPRDPHLSVVLARIHLGLSQLGEAEKHARAARTNDPRNVVVAYALASVLIEKGDASGLSEAHTLLREIVTVNDGDADAHADLGRVARMQGDLAGARKSLERALQLAPRHRIAVRQLAEVCAATGDRARATELHRRTEELARDDLQRRELLRYLAQAPADGKALFQIGDLYARDGEYLPAIDNLQRAAEVLEGDPKVLARLVEVRALARAAGSTR